MVVFLVVVENWNFLSLRFVALLDVYDMKCFASSFL
jgi:hypothetical protein